MSFNKHEQSACHKQAVEDAITLPATTTSIGNLLVKERAKQPL